MYIVTVSFEVEPSHFGEFVSQLKIDAAASLASEAGCHQFDMCVGDNSRDVFIYEVYEQAEDFENHLNSPHFKAFMTACSTMIMSKTVNIYQRVEL